MIPFQIIDSVSHIINTADDTVAHGGETSLHFLQQVLDLGFFPGRPEFSKGNVKLSRHCIGQIIIHIEEQHSSTVKKN